MFVVAHVQLITLELCAWERDQGDVVMWVSYTQLDVHSADAVLKCITAPRFSVLFSTSNHILFISGYSRTASFIIRFQSQSSFGRSSLDHTTTSQYSGYLTSPGFDDLSLTPGHVSAYYNLTSHHDAIMISFERLLIRELVSPCDSYLRLYVFDKVSQSLLHVGQWCNQKDFDSAEVFHTSYALLEYRTETETTLSVGFNMRYSFHHKNMMPQILDKGLFNCSVDYYPTFQQHLKCNMKIECEDGQDETGHCPFSNDFCGGLKVASNRKCFFVVLSPDLSQSKSPKYFNQECQKRGGTLAVTHTHKELLDLKTLLSAGRHRDRCDSYILGSTYGNTAASGMYQQTWLGVDHSVQYDSSPEIGYIRHRMLFTGEKLCKTFVISIKEEIQINPCDKILTCGSVCQVYSDNYFPDNHVQQPEYTNSYNFSLENKSLVLLRSKFVLCPEKHFVHSFISCDNEMLFQHGNCDRDILNQGWQAMDQITLPQRLDNFSKILFQCDDKSTVHYTLVCDFRADCLDQSDEAFCQHSPCPEERCTSGQCFSYIERCNIHSDCLDNTDEENCEGFRQYEIRNTIIDSPAIINLNGRGHFNAVPLNNSDPCPATHYRCARQQQQQYCLPIFTRCNGFYDCISHEDEWDGSNIACPGLYRCRDSMVCLMTDNLCDGVSHCPKDDDELFCEEKKCPIECHCQGFAFICTQMFAVWHYPGLRYLDGSGTGLTLNDVRSNMHLVYLNLARCLMSNVENMDLPNLRHLDLSTNNIREININIFLYTKNLRILILRGNPLEVVYSQPSNMLQRSLSFLDLSFTRLKSFNSRIFSSFLSVQTLNLSYASVTIIDNSGFQDLPNLRKIDLSNNPVKTFPDDLFQGVFKLEAIFSPTYKLCCKSVLPRQFEQHFCFAPQDELSNCEDLLRSGTYRVFLWLVSLLSITGNIFSLVFRTVIHRKSKKSGFNIFVSSLCVSDLLMGVFVIVIGIADLRLSGIYVHEDVSWMQSNSCKAAGCLALVSSEVSLITILFITVDRFLVLHFPFSRLRFDKRTALMICSLSWMLGVIAAGIPLLPLTSHWQFYSQTGICIPLAVTRHDFQGRNYAFGVMIIFNLALLLLITIGQGVIYWSVQTNDLVISGSTTRKSRDVSVAKRLFMVAVTDILCWFPICLCGLLASIGLAIPGEVNVAMIIFALPLNSTLNPFLYTFTVVLEKRRLVFEERLMRELRAKIESQKDT